MLEPFSNAEIRRLKAAAQLMEPMFKVGRAGVTESLIEAVSEALLRHELVKIKFVEFKDQKKVLAPQLAGKTRSHLVMRVGNVMVLHRPRKTDEPSEE